MPRCHNRHVRRAPPEEPPEAGDPPGRRVQRFVEKPDAPTAARYLESGDYLWNSGMFVFQAARYLEELGEHAPQILTAARRAVEGARRSGPIVALNEEAFAACPAESIDYAVMEHTDRAAVLPLAAAWSDVGSWRSVWEVSPRDDADNALVGDVLALSTRRSYVRAEDRLVVVGMEDVVVVETEDGLLVCQLDDAEVVKAAVSRLADQQRPEVESFPQ
jgi:mannose-1-phosphate guanylyltransferase/mannose-6-phosphate isomerase